MALRHLLLIVGLSAGQHPGSQKENEHLSMKIQECSAGGSCKDGRHPYYCICPSQNIVHPWALVPKENKPFYFTLFFAPPVQTKVTLDSNWRWLHIKDDYVNCYDGNLWDEEFCPDNPTCTENCVLGGFYSKSA